MKVTPQERPEMLRRLRLGNLRTLFRHRYGSIFPDDDAGREDLRELLLPVSLGPNADIKMPNIVEVWAPWMSPADAALLIDDINRTSITLRKPKAAALGIRLNVTDAERERLQLWTIAPCDITADEVAELRKAKRRARDQARRRSRGKPTRAQWLAANKASASTPWIAAGISRATWYRRRETETGVRPGNASIARREPVSRSKLNRHKGGPCSMRAGRRRQTSEVSKRKGQRRGSVKVGAKRKGQGKA